MEQKGNMQASPAVRERPCLVCGRKFAVAGPYLRVCALCKESEEWQSGDDDFILHGLEAANDN